MNFPIKSENLSPQDIAEVSIKVERDDEASGMSRDYDFKDVASDIKFEETEVRTNPMEPHTCEECDATFDSLASYAVHLEIEHRPSSTSDFTNRRNFAQPEETSNNPKGTQKQGNFNHGSYSLRCMPDLKKQVGTCDDKTPFKFKCDVCNYSTMYQSHFKLHMFTHTGEKPYKCDVCDHGYISASNLRKHMMTHTGEKPFKCDVCDYSCIEKSALKQHMMTHSGEKPYKCDVCDYRCNEKSSLKKHMMTHTGEKPYQCDVCDYRCIVMFKLKRHMMTHSGENPYKCDVCDYSCIDKRSLKRHMITHTGEKPLKCDICDFSCGYKSSLKRHMRIHSTENPFDVQDKII